MKQYFLAILLILLSSYTAAKGSDSITSEHRDIARSQIKDLGFSLNDIDFKDEGVKIFGSCHNGIWEQGDPEYLIVDFQLKKAKTVKGISFGQGNRIRLCDGKLSDASGSEEYLVEGKRCARSANFDIHGKLCGCQLSAPAVIEGIKVPKGVKVLWRESKLYAIYVTDNPVKINEREVTKGYYQFLNGKLQYQKEWANVDTCDEDIYFSK